MRNIARIGFLVLFSFTVFLAAAQVEEPAPEFDFAEPDSSTMMEDDATGQELDENGNPKAAKLTAKPYQRIVLVIDSATNLITYNGVMEQEESGSDSLYIRAKRWVAKNLGKEVKLEMDKRNQKLTYIGSIPAYSYLNKYTKRPMGRFEFKLTIFIKEGRYRYQISNIVHESVKPADGKGTRNYFEYYYTSTVKVREHDAILRNADRDILKLIESLKAALREPVIVDEDDW
ncbi:MAG: DUF4468 domain-containing protein [Bacteroidota bacterium]|nr:DUF4468 domain-containing protein [Bacteroidota bacterium]